MFYIGSKQFYEQLGYLTGRPRRKRALSIDVAEDLTQCQKSPAKKSKRLSISQVLFEVHFTFQLIYIALLACYKSERNVFHI